MRPTTTSSHTVKDSSDIDVSYIQQHLPSTIKCQLLAIVDSTQSTVKANSLLIAEHQTTGVGRRGNKWLSPKGRSISLSYRFQLALPAAKMSGYQMTIASAILDAITSYEPNTAVQLKWPNDLYSDGKKFAGILINLLPHKTMTEVIVGIGINWQLNAAEIKSVDQAVCNIPLIFSATKQRPKRHEFIAQLMQNINANNQQFMQQGLDSFLSTWHHHDFLLNKGLRLTVGKEQIEGQYAGINHLGELLLKTHLGIKAFSSGEVSVKAL